jgi:hypothetical protein
MLTAILIVLSIVAGAILGVVGTCVYIARGFLK